MREVDEKGIADIMRKWSILTAFTTLGLLVAPAVADAATVQYVETNHGWVSYHAGPRLSSPIQGRLQLGDKAQLLGKPNQWWYEISVHGSAVYVTTSANYVHVVTASTPTPVAAPAPAPAPVVTPTPAPVPALPAWQTQANQVIASAKTQLGAPYYWGHQVPIGSVPAGQPYGFDCSNFVAWSYRTALGIRFSGASVYQRYNVGTPVPVNQIREGDLLFFATSTNATGSGHVGLYLGNGMVIQEGGGWGHVTIEPLSGTWLGRNLVFARRVLNG